MPFNALQLPEATNIERVSGNTLFSLIGNDVDVEVVSRTIEPCPFLEKLRPLFRDIKPEQVPEIEKTIHYLYTKFQPLYNLFNTRFGVTDEYFLEVLVIRLTEQIQLANNTPGKKFYNSYVSSLKRMSADKNGGMKMELENIPYWAFACTGVSLDAVQLDTQDGKKSLRDLLDSISEDGKNGVGEYVLPNSLGVSVMIQLADGTIIGQQRNNTTTLTQYHGLMSSASGAMIPLEKGSHKLPALLTGASAELVEELGVTSAHLPHLPDITDMAVSMQQHILRELGLSNTSFAALTPLGVVIEGKRRNPEVVFTLVLPPSVTFDDVYEKWQTAQDKDESRGLVAVTPEEVEHQLTYYEKHIPQELFHSPTGLEQFIAGHPDCADGVGSHFLMSFLAWKKSLENKIAGFNSRVFELLPPPRSFAPHVESLEFPGSPHKPSEDHIVINKSTGVYGVCDGATGLSSPPNMTTTGGRMASQTVSRVLSDTSGNIISALEAANRVLEDTQIQQGVDLKDTANRFMTSASIVRQTTGGLEFVNAGDSTIIVEYVDGKIEIITEKVDHDEEALQLWAQLVQEKGPGVTYDDIRFDSRMKDILIQGRQKANVPNGNYGVLSGQYLPGSALQKGFIPYNKNGGIKRVILFTDGFEIPTQEPWNKNDSYYREWLSEFDKLGAEGLKKKIQDIAKNDPHCLQYPRFKPLDDGSIMELNFSKIHPTSTTHRIFPSLKPAKIAA